MPEAEHTDHELETTRRLDTQDVLSDAVLGMADGLTVPFALTAGLSSLGSSKLVVIGGLAELFSGAISMGLGAYLAAETERQQYHSQHKLPDRENRVSAEESIVELQNTLDSYGMKQEDVKVFVEALTDIPNALDKFRRDFKVCPPPPAISKAYLSALTMGLSYFIGGILPMIPYFIMPEVRKALFVSIGITVFILIVFGYTKGLLAGCTLRQSAWSAVQTLGVGAAAAGASYGIVRAVDESHIQ